MEGWARQPCAAAPRHHAACVCWLLHATAHMRLLTCACRPGCLSLLSTLQRARPTLRMMSSCMPWGGARWTPTTAAPPSACRTWGCLLWGGSSAGGSGATRGRATAWWERATSALACSPSATSALVTRAAPCCCAAAAQAATCKSASRASPSPPAPCRACPASSHSSHTTGKGCGCVGAAVGTRLLSTHQSCRQTVGPTEL